MVLLGKRIKELRNKYKLTQTELAEKVGVTKSTVAAYENDSRQPSYEVLIKMALVFKVTVDSLLLNRSELVLDAHGLTEEQMELIGLHIAYFRRINSVGHYYEKAAPEAFEMVKEHLDNKIDE